MTAMKSSHLFSLALQSGRTPAKIAADLDRGEYWPLPDDEALIPDKTRGFGSGWMDFLGLALSKRDESPIR
jgi:hypothetical protein